MKLKEFKELIEDASPESEVEVLINGYAVKVTDVDYDSISVIIKPEE